MATEMLCISLEERSRTNSTRQRFHSQLFCQTARYFFIGNGNEAYFLHIHSLIENKQEGNEQ